MKSKQTRIVLLQTIGPHEVGSTIALNPMLAAKLIAQGKAEIEAEKPKAPETKQDPEPKKPEPKPKAEKPKAEKNSSGLLISKPMTKLIDNTSFVGRYYVANNTDAAISAHLNYLVTTYQPVFLRMLMGPKKATEFQTWLDITPADRPVNETWTALLTSGLFTNERGDDEFREAITKPLASYCYDIWQRGNVTQTTSSGEASTLSQNAEEGSPQQKLIDRNFEMVENCKGIYDYLSVLFKTDADWLRWIRSFSGFSIWADFPTRYPNNALFENVNQFGL